ncbi:MAG: amidohydrolase family protein [Ectothiorhodospiraceae bacterium]|nr:amidohydrolase family protein [Chromatiales bacterium]MCP5156970.1 amidohydrolase family protein [Ectothiorhodospiraceae bacterium]
MSETTVIRNADWTVAWDRQGERHVYARGADVAFRGNEIVHVGARYEGPVDHEIDGRERMVMPGLVNVHSHPSSEPLRKGITDETHSPGFHHSSLYEFLTVFDNDPEGRVACLQVALAELLLSGCTTITDLSAPYEEWLDTLAASGIRAVVAPGFRDARWFTRNGHALDYEWKPGSGKKGFEEAIRVIDRANQHPSGRLSGMVYPAQIDTCEPATMRDSFDFARGRDLPWQIHAAQSVAEFHEIQRRHGMTPIQYLDSLGVLDDNSIIGHGIFLDHHPWLHWTTRKDLALLADRGATVAHCPTVFARRGITLRTFGGYRRAGINLGIGTDTYPHHFLEEMRSAMYYARVIGESVADLDARDIFDAATIGGARALRRDDIGRLAVGAKADIVLVDTRHPSMMPLREPVRSLLFVAAERPIRSVYVDGVRVVEDGRVLNIDLAAASAALQEAQARSLARTPGLDWAGRSADEMAPMAYGTVDATTL